MGWGCSSCNGDASAGSWGKCARPTRLKIRIACVGRHEKELQQQEHVRRLQYHQDDRFTIAPSEAGLRAVAAELQKRPVGEGGRHGWPDQDNTEDAMVRCRSFVCGDKPLVV